eukprot:jgi/Botrbrau1/13878/Bobra.0056s0110.1
MDVVHIRKISGTGVSVPVHVNTTVRDLKCSLNSQRIHDGLVPSAWKLLFQGRELKDEELVSDLAISKDGFLVAVETRRNGKRQPGNGGWNTNGSLDGIPAKRTAVVGPAARRLADAFAGSDDPPAPRLDHNNPPPCSPNQVQHLQCSAPSTAPVSPATSSGAWTLLPGYASRPNASPAKPKVPKKPSEGGFLRPGIEPAPSAAATTHAYPTADRETTGETLRPVKARKLAEDVWETLARELADAPVMATLASDLAPQGPATETTPCSTATGGNDAGTPLTTLHASPSCGIANGGTDAVTASATLQGSPAAESLQGNQEAVEGHGHDARAPSGGNLRGVSQSGAHPAENGLQTEASTGGLGSSLDGGIAMPRPTHGRASRRKRGGSGAAGRNTNLGRVPGQAAAGGSEVVPKAVPELVPEVKPDPDGPVIAAGRELPGRKRGGRRRGAVTSGERAVQSGGTAAGGDMGREEVEEEVPQARRVRRSRRNVEKAAQAGSDLDARDGRREAKCREGTPAGGRRDPRDVLQRMIEHRLLPREAAALDQLPLPLVLDRLLRIFQAVNGVYGFLLRQHIQATWGKMKRAVCDILGSADVHMQDVETMAQLCPEVVILRDRRVINSPASMIQRRQQQVQPGGTAGQGPPREWPAGGPQMVDGEFGPPSVLGTGSSDDDGADDDVIPVNTANPQEIRTDGAGTVLEGEKDFYIIEVVDPGRRTGPAAASLEAFGVDSPDNEVGLTARSLGARVRPLESLEMTEQAGNNAATRRSRAFRRSLALATAHLHNQWLASPDCCLDRDGQQRPAEPSTPVRRSSRLQRSEDVGVPPVHCSCPRFSAADPSQTFCPVTAGAWAPGFPVEALPLGRLLQAAAELRRALPIGDVVPGQHPGGPGRQRAAPRPPFLARNHVPCTDTTTMDTEEFLAHLKSLPWYKDQVVHVEELAARRAQTQQPQRALSGGIRGALEARGIYSLFVHQAQAIDYIMEGHNVVVATSTASGKSLCYNLPILEAVAKNPGATAIYMFPTKALAQDQLRALRELCARVFGDASPRIDVYDGDTAKADRAEVRERAQLLITNPDMLHQSILPVHRQFARLLTNLKYVVVDEGHAYRGVFGCHTALVMRRLRRLCERVYASRPQFIMTSATIANPAQHMCDLLGLEEVKLVSQDGSPHGPQRFVLWNPPLTRQAEASARSGNMHLSRTEGRARGGKGRSRRAELERLRALMQDAEQERGRGARLAQGSADSFGMSQAEWLASVKMGRRRANAAAAAIADILDIDMTSAQALASKAPDTSLARLNKLLSSPRSETHSVRDASASPTRHLQAFARPHTPGPETLQSPRVPGPPASHAGPVQAAPEHFQAEMGDTTILGTPQESQRTVAEDCQTEHGLAGDLSVGHHPTLPDLETSCRVPGPSSNQQGNDGGCTEPPQGTSMPRAHVKPMLRLVPPAVSEQVSTGKSHQDGATSGRRIEPAALESCSAAEQRVNQLSADEPGGNPGSGPARRVVGSKISTAVGRARRRRDEDVAQAAAERDHTQWLQDLEALAVGEPTAKRADRAIGGRQTGPEDELLRVASSGNVGQLDQQEDPQGLTDGVHGGGPIKELPGPHPLLKRKVFGIPLCLPQTSTGESEQADAQSRLPDVGDGKWKERHGAAGVKLDQHRSSPIVELSLLLAECIQHNLRTIAFCKTRKCCELITAYTRETLKATAPHLADSLSVYRAGYSPEERREIERALFSGELRAVAATNALELGVDVGSLDVTLHLGFPGSVASLWQQAGRAGRREQASLSIYIAFDGPLDQYFMCHPDQLFGRPLENCQVDASNLQLMTQHLVCAAAESPLLLREDVAYFGPGLSDAVQTLISARMVAGILKPAARRCFTTSASRTTPLRRSACEPSTPTASQSSMRPTAPSLRRLRRARPSSRSTMVLSTCTREGHTCARNWTWTVR